MASKQTKLVAGGCALVAALGALCVLIGGVRVVKARSAEEEAWSKVTPTAKAHQAYLDWAIVRQEEGLYSRWTPLLEHQAQASAELPHLECAEALEAGDLAALRSYVRFNGSGRHAEEARGVLAKHIRALRAEYLKLAGRRHVSEGARAALGGALERFAAAGGALGSITWSFESLEGAEALIPGREEAIEEWEGAAQAKVKEALRERFPDVFYETYGSSEAEAPRLTVSPRTYFSGRRMSLIVNGEAWGEDRDTTSILGFALALSGDEEGAREAFAKHGELCWADGPLWLAGLGGDLALARKLAQEERWEADLARYYLGSLSAEEVLEAARAAPEADRPERLLYAHLHVGLKLEQAGETDAAREHYRQAMAQKKDDYTEHMLAARRLKRLGE